MDVTKLVVSGTGGAGLRKRQEPSTDSSVLGILPEGTEVEVIETSGDWRRVVGQSYWVYGAYLALPKPASQSAASDVRKLLGIHELKPGFARAAIANGAKAVTVFNDATEARALSVENPDVIVNHRIYFTSLPDPKDILSRHAIDPGTSSRVWAHGINEYDVPGFGGSVEEILRRAAWDTECAMRLKDMAPSAEWVAGGFPHGNPDFTKPEICDAVYRGYADGYNRGLFKFNIHNYTKAGPGGPLDFNYYDPQWFEARALKLIYQCGFRPDIQGLMAKESGIEAGAGGFAWANYTTEQFEAWCRRYIGCMSAPIAWQGATYPSPFACSTLFQSGDEGHGSGEWGGYSTAAYKDALHDIYTNGLQRIPRALVTGAEPEHGIIPDKKIIKLEK